RINQTYDASSALNLCGIVPHDPPSSTLYFGARNQGLRLRLHTSWSRCLHAIKSSPLRRKKGLILAHSTDDAGVTRRDFIYVASAALAAGGAVVAAWPLIDQMNPSADTLALKEIEVDLTPIAPGQQITVEWQKKPVFIRRRTPEEIKEAQDVPL